MPGPSSQPPFSASSSTAVSLTVAGPTPGVRPLAFPMSSAVPIVDRLLGGQLSRAVSDLSSGATAAAFLAAVTSADVQDALADEALVFQELHLAFDLALLVNQPQVFVPGGAATWLLTADVFETAAAILHDPLFATAPGRQVGEKALAFGLSLWGHGNAGLSAL